MSQEITVNQKISASKGSLAITKSVTNFKVDMAGTHGFSQVFDLSTTDVQIVIPSNIVTYGWAYFVNLSDTTNVEISTGHGATFTAHTFALLYPGEVALLPIAPVQNYYAASTSEYGTEISLEVTVIER